MDGEDAKVRRYWPECTQRAIDGKSCGKQTSQVVGSLFGFSGALQCSWVSPCCSRAQQNDQKHQTDFGLLYPPSPRPSGRCPQRPLTFLVHSSQSTVVNQRREGWADASFVGGFSFGIKLQDSVGRRSRGATGPKDGASFSAS